MPPYEQVVIVLSAAILAVSIRHACWSLGLVSLSKKGGFWWSIVCAFTALAAASLVVAFLPMPVSMVFAGYCSLLAAMSTIDFEEKLLPKGVWVAGLLFALTLSAIVPSLVGETEPLRAILASALGALLSGAVIYAMVELGKVLFGKLHMEFASPEKYTISTVEGQWVVTNAGETMPLSEIMMRPTDYILVKEADGREIRIWESSWENPAGTEKHPLREHSGTMRSLTIPREAMGMGDVKFMLMAGAMLGWEGGVFSIFAGAVLGTVVCLIGRLLCGQNELPFIPFLASGMIVFMVWSEDLRKILSTLWSF
jgi:leader peptidase (prepilin peptidase)/N-methyltransferase